MPTTLSPSSDTNTIVLPITGSVTEVASACPFGIYTGSADFLSGATDQIAYTYKKLGGDVLDIELSSSQVYAAYEEAVLEYSYIVNIHQTKNTLSTYLGHTTGTFNHNGELKSGTLSSSLSGTHAALKFPKYEISYARRVSDAFSGEAAVGGSQTMYSASFSITASRQDYDLQNIISGAAESNYDDGTGKTVPYAGKVGSKKVKIHKVYYKTPNVMWRFFGYYGGVNTVGNLGNYGMFSDDSTFQIIPSWQNKMQAITYEDNIFTRVSHYSYEIVNNKLRLFPTPQGPTADTFWVTFTIPEDPFVDDSDVDHGISGINNMNTMPFENIPYGNINSIGKQWIRRFALSLTKEMLGQVRGKFATIPIPGESVTLNAAELLSQAKEEQEKLREELKTVLDELTYAKIMETDAQMMESAGKIQEKVPLAIFVG